MQQKVDIYQKIVTSIKNKYNNDSNKYKN